MSANLPSPVQTQMAVAVLNNTLRSEFHGSNEYHGSQKFEGKPVGRRRVFVQTETGCVLGIELDRGDNAHTVKRRLQVALNVSTEESSLTFGDRVLHNDLSTIRNDSPLLLTRNQFHRSSSTPCLSPTAKDTQQRDQSGPIEVLGCSSHCSRTKQLVKDVAKAIKSGLDPIPVHSGLGGAYYFRNSRGESVAIVKPTDEEPFAPNNPKGFVGKTLGQPGLKRSVRVGETGFREVAAYLLDYDRFANVPPTVLVKITHSIFHVNEGVNCGNNKAYGRQPRAISKIASFQQFMPHDFDASDHGTSSFPVAAVHRIGILDIRIFNTDRHAGNLLVRKVEGGVGRFGCQTELIPIDHGLCLPESLEDPYFEWIHWPQASIPFSDDELKYIANLDPVRDSDMLRMELPMVREACLRVLVLCTIFLKEAAAFGLCLAEIGEMMSREFTGREEEPSELEVVCIEARRLVAERQMFFPEAETRDEDDILFNIDYEEANAVIPITPPSIFGIKGGSRNPLSKLDENLEEEDEDSEDTMEDEKINFPTLSRNPLSKLDENFEEEDEDSEETMEDEKINFPTLSRNPLSKLDENLEEEDEDTEDTMEDEKSNFSTPKQLPTVPKLFMSLKGVTLAEKAYCGVTKGAHTSGKNNNSGLAGTRSGNWSTNEQLPASVRFVQLADMGEEEWGMFLEKFQELLNGAFRGRKCRAFGRQRLGTSCQF